MNFVTITAYIIAIAVPAFTVYLFVALDVFGTGKPSTLLMCGAWGALGAFFLAWGINNAVSDRGVTYETLTRVTAPTIEEILKALVLVYLVFQPRFRYIVDGAVYGIAVGIGFALSENLFIYLPSAGEAVLATAISRTLSTSLMHATASSLVGIALGRLRRSTERQKSLWAVLGIGLAIGLHALYNNLAGELVGLQLLLVAFGIGIGGGLVIAWQINQSLAEEKRRFAQTLGVSVGVGTDEIKAIQRLGGTSIEQIFDELGKSFGEENVSLVRRLFIVQANIGILRNNLSGPASTRLRAAWEEEIAGYRVEIDQIRKKLGPSVNLFVQSVFPSGDAAMQEAFTEELARLDPTMIHTFDMFTRVSELAQTFTPEELEQMAERLSKIDIFRKVSLAHLENLSRAITTQDFVAGAMLFNEGDEGNAMYMLEQGEIELYIHDQSGQEKFLRALHPGDVVGEFALLDGQPRSARAQAKGAAHVLVLSREAFYRFIQSRPDVVLTVLQYLARKIRHTTQTVEASVISMRKLGEGDYAIMMAASLAQTLPGRHPVPAPDVIPDAIETLEPDQISDETPNLVSGVFSRAAILLQRREASYRQQHGEESAG